MALENKLNIMDSIELARMEEKISKKKAVELFENGYLDKYKADSFEMLAAIHEYLFGEIYDFAGKVRNVNIAKGNFRFAPVMYLQVAIENVEKMPQSTFDEIIEKYVEIRGQFRSYNQYNEEHNRLILHVFATKTHGREQKCHATITITDNEREVKGYGKINSADGLEQLEHIW